MPLWRKAAALIWSSPARDAVWEETAFFPASVRPDFSAMIGFTAVTLRATSMNLRPLVTSSMYIAITSMFSSFPRNSRMSVSLMSILLPIVATIPKSMTRRSPVRMPAA